VAATGNGGNVMKRVTLVVAGVLAAGAVAVATVAYTGAYNVAADDPHWDMTSRALAWARDRAIAVRAGDVVAPNLADPSLIALGAEHYAAMCEGCHLAPGARDNEMRQGLYPKPPNLSTSRGRHPAETFWIVKHGVKMSGMPAWGVTHDDESIWGLVAFLQQLPTLDAEDYRTMTGAGSDSGPGAQEGHGHGEHGHGDENVGSRASTSPSLIDAYQSPESESQPHDHVQGEAHEH
jgi:mono/diheme cytochrome c family protein